MVSASITLNEEKEEENNHRAGKKYSLSPFPNMDYNKQKFKYI